MQKCQLVTNPSEFDHELLKQLIFEPPVDKSKCQQVDFYYLAVFDKAVNFPGDTYRVMLKEQLSHDSIVDAVLTVPSGFQHGFGSDEEDITVDTWYFKADSEGGNKPSMVVIVLAEVTSSTPPPSTLTA